MTDARDPQPGQASPGEKSAPGAAGGTGASRGERRRGALLALFVLILATMAGAAGGGYWLWERLQASRQAAEAQETRWRARAQALEQRLAETEARQRERMQTQIESLRRELAALSQSLGTLEAWARAGGAQGVDPRAWSLAQARLLLLTAAYQSSAHRREEARQALEAASARLAAVDDAALAPVRERLAADLEALRRSPDPDLGELDAALRELAREARGLPLPPSAPSEPSASEAPPEPEAVGGWRGVLDAVWRNAKELIVVRRVGEGGDPGWLPEERRLMHQRVYLALEGARLAALRRDAPAFQAGLGAAREWLTARADAGSPRVQALVRRMQELETTALAAQGVDPLETLRLLERTLSAAAPSAAPPR